MQVKEAAICQLEGNAEPPTFSRKASVCNPNKLSVGYLRNPGSGGMEADKRQLSRRGRFSQIPLREALKKLPFLQPFPAPSGPPGRGRAHMLVRVTRTTSLCGPGLVSGSQRRTKCLLCHMQRTLSPKCRSGSLMCCADVTGCGPRLGFCFFCPP